MGGFIASSFTFKNEIFEIVILDEFDVSMGEEGYIEIWLRDREKFGVFKLFMIYLSELKTTMIFWIRESVHGQLFSLEFIDRVFEEVCACLQERYGLSELILTLGAYPHREPSGSFEKAVERLLQEEDDIEILF